MPSSGGRTSWAACSQGSALGSAWIPTNCSHYCGIALEPEVLVWLGDSWEWGWKLPVVWRGSPTFPGQQKLGVQVSATTTDHPSR